MDLVLFVNEWVTSLFTCRNVLVKQSGELFAGCLCWAEDKCLSRVILAADQVPYPLPVTGYLYLLLERDLYLLKRLLLIVFLDTEESLVGLDVLRDLYRSELCFVEACI